jgi:hypothetical protein
MRALLKLYKSERKYHKSIWQMIYLSDWFDPIYKVIRFFPKTYEKLNRMIFWGWKLRYSWDFDASTLYEIIYLKLDRVQKCCLKHGHLEWDSSPDTNLMRKLSELKGLAKRLSEDNYHKNSSRFHDMYCRLDQNKSPLDYMFTKHHPEARPISETMYSFFFKKAIDADNKEKIADKKRFYYLMDKYLESFWD